jgi:hypothetical protein
MRLLVLVLTPAWMFLSLTAALIHDSIQVQVQLTKQESNPLQLRASSYVRSEASTLFSSHPPAREGLPVSMLLRAMYRWRMVVTIKKQRWLAEYGKSDGRAQGRK